MTEIQKRLLSLVYTCNGHPIESSNREWIEAMEYLEQRGLVHWRWVNDGAYHEAVWVTPARKRESLDWEKETQLARDSI